jgi:hypothetical protein
MSAEGHMSTLADILVNVRPPINLKEDRPEIQVRHIIRDALKEAPVVVINDVARYFFETFWEEHETLDHSDFPNVAPPFSLFWMEYRVPKTITGGEPRQTVPMEFGGQRAGFFWFADERQSANKGWRLTSFMFVEDDGWAVGPLFTTRADVDAQGHLVEFLSHSYVPSDAATPKEVRELSDNGMMDLHFPVALAICFMHCSNVRLEEHMAKESHRRKHEKLYGRAPIVYKTLNITPMRGIIRSKGGAHCGLKQALHIMRGHFKRFDAKPLFGKHKGMWWWSSALRGSLEHGYVKKTYEVHAPEEDDREEKKHQPAKN